MKKIPVNILLTCAGSNTTPISLKGLKRSKKYKPKIILADANKLVPNLYLNGVYRRYCIPKCHEQNYIKSLISLIKKEKINILHSVLDEEMPILAKNKKTINAAGCKFLLPEEKPLECGFDKKEMYLQLKDKVNLPATYFLTDQSLKYFDIYHFHKGRVFLKHAKGRGGRGMYFPSYYKEFIFYIDKLKREKLIDKYVIQEYIDGEEYNVLTLHDNQRKKIFATSRQKLTESKIKSNTNVAMIKNRKNLINLAIKAIKIMKLDRGYNNVDIRVSRRNNRPYLTEINGGRISAQDMNVFASGINLIELYIDIIRGEKVKSIPISNIKNGITMLRTNNDIIIEKNDIRKTIDI